MFVAVAGGHLPAVPVPPAAAPREILLEMQRVRGVMGVLGVRSEAVLWVGSQHDCEGLSHIRALLVDSAQVVDECVDEVHLRCDPGGFPPPAVLPRGAEKRQCVAGGVGAREQQEQEG
jgi:hypothetical protein